MYILGAGMAGCLAGIMNGGSMILEAAPSLPNNHHGVLRFRTDNISKITGIPFKKVVVRKAVWDGIEFSSCPPRLANLYSQKVVGSIQDRSILNLEPAVRYIAPEDFHSRLGKMLEGRIQFNSMVTSITGRRIEMSPSFHGWERGSNPEPIISTIPMTVISKITGTPFPDLKVDPIRPIYVCRIRLFNANVHQTIYYPSHDTNVYRASIVGDLLIIESLESSITREEQFMVWQSFGIENIQYKIIDDMNDLVVEKGKLSPIDDNARKKYMLDLSTNLNIWSLGRYACWRPSVLLDDVYDDILKIRAMQGCHTYDVKKQTI